MSCTPHWAEQGSCPYGKVFPADFFGLRWTTWPDSSDTAGPFICFVNVLYSICPMLFLLSVFGYSIYVLSMVDQKTDLGKIIVVGRYTLWCCLVLVLNFVQKMFFDQLPNGLSMRPEKSCLKTCGMPDEWSVLAGGFGIMIAWDLYVRSVEIPLHQAFKGSSCWGEKFEVIERYRRLGYKQAKMEDVKMYYMAAALLLLPMPYARIMVNDSTWFQMVLGVAEGAFLAGLINKLRFNKLISTADFATEELPFQSVDDWTEVELKKFYDAKNISLKKNVVAVLVTDKEDLPIAVADPREFQKEDFRITERISMKDAAFPITLKVTTKDDRNLEEFLDLIRRGLSKAARLLRRQDEGELEQPFLDRAESSGRGDDLETGGGAGERRAFDHRRSEAGSVAAQLNIERDLNRRRAEAHASQLRREKEEAVQEAEEEKRLAVQAANEAMEKAVAEVQEEKRRKLEEARSQMEEDMKRAAAERAQMETQAQVELEGLERKRREAQQKHEDMMRQQEEKNAEDIRGLRKKHQDSLNELQDYAKSFKGIQDAIKEGDSEKLKGELQKAEKPEGDMDQDTSELRKLIKGNTLENAKKKMDVWARCASEFKKQVNDDRNHKKAFRAWMACVKEGIDLKVHEGEELNKLEDMWKEQRAEKATCKAKDAMDTQNELIKRVIKGSINDVGSIDVTDMEDCLEMLDCDPEQHKLFYRLAKQVIFGSKDKVARKPKEYTRALSTLANLIFFLAYLPFEKRQLCIRMMKEKNPVGEGAGRLVHNVAEKYKLGVLPESQSGVLDKGVLDAAESNPQDVLKMMVAYKEESAVPRELNEIFHQLGRTWLDSFGALALPHHCQVAAIMVFKEFLESKSDGIKTLIGQVSTGEGKSMLIACLSVFLVLAKKKKVHVIGGDEKLTVRDYQAFRGLFKWAHEKMRDNAAVKDSFEDFSICCSSKADAYPDEKDITRAVKDDAWIVYCESKHLMLHYANTAKYPETYEGFGKYQDIVLLIDEVDALVVDEKPTVELVYDRQRQPLGGQDLTVQEYATSLLRKLKKKEEIAPPNPSDPAYEEMLAIYKGVKKNWKKAKQWHDKPKEEQDLEYRVSKSEDKYVKVDGAKEVTDFHSNFLECLRFSVNDHYQLHWFERLFVMSKPCVFSSYHAILGFSGTTGNDEERKFLEEAYNANFFVVPRFLETCDPKEKYGKQEGLTSFYKGPRWCGKPEWGMKGPVMVLPRQPDQIKTLTEIAFKARKKVPVLVITDSTESVDKIVGFLRREVNNLPQQNFSQYDMVQSLSNDDYVENPIEYKQTLRLSTCPISSKKSGVTKEWRITVTDPTGARGTDYKMRDLDADNEGGLLLLMTFIPTGERDWVQFLGRTARQEWNGQYCCILNTNVIHSRSPPEGQEPVIRGLMKEATRPGEGNFLSPCGQLEVTEKKNTTSQAGKTLKDALKIRLTGSHEDVAETWLWTAKDPEEFAKAVLKYGNRASKQRLDECKCLYQSGYLANLICQKYWEAMAKKHIPSNEQTKIFKQICSTYKNNDKAAMQKFAESQKCLPEGFQVQFDKTLLDKFDYTPQAVKPKLVFLVMDRSYGPIMEVANAAIPGMYEESIGIGSKVALYAIGEDNDKDVALKELVPPTEKSTANAGDLIKRISSECKTTGGNYLLYVSIKTAIDKMNAASDLECGEWVGGVWKEPRQLECGEWVVHTGKAAQVIAVNRDEQKIDLRKESAIEKNVPFQEIKQQKYDPWIVLLTDNFDSGPQPDVQKARELDEDRISKIDVAISQPFTLAVVDAHEVSKYKPELDQWPAWLKNMETIQKHIENKGIKPYHLKAASTQELAMRFQEVSDLMDPDDGGIDATAQ